MKASITFSELSLNQLQEFVDCGKGLDERARADEKPVRGSSREVDDAPHDDKPSQGDTTDEKPARRRQRRPTEAPSGGKETPVETKPKARRRRRKASADGESSDVRGESSEDEGSDGATTEITDADVSKKASEGANELTPVGVRKILDDMKLGHVDNVADLDQDQRRKFIAKVDAAIKNQLDDTIPF